MKRRVSVVLIIAQLFLSVAAFAQSNPVRWTKSVEKIDASTYRLVFKASIEPGYHLYDLGPYDGGPNPTVITFPKLEGAKLVGSVEMMDKPVRHFDDMFEMEIGYFEKSGRFAQKVALTAAKATVTANVEWMSCNDQSCTPPADQDFTFELEGEPLAATPAAKPAATTPAEPAKQEPAAVEPTEPTADRADSVAAESVEEPASESVIEQGTADSGKVKDAEGEGKSIWAMILEAIIWGFVALLTPCVFPMVPMTVSFFMKGSENKATGRFRALMYGLFIILVYTIPIAIIIVATRIIGGAAVTADIFNWLATHWLPNLIFFAVFMIFAASFFGAFEIVLPSKLVNGSDQKADRGGLGGIFFMALTLVLVSFSCTGPIIGTVLIKSTAGEFWTPIVTMLAFSVAFALPFTLLALFPSWLKKLPKSGGWLNSVKVVLGFVELALGLKFLGVADQTYHWGLLDREVYLGLWIVIFSMLGFYLLGKLKFKHDSDVPHIGITRLVLSIITFTFVVYMIPGMWGAPLKALSGYLPPIQTQDFVLGQDAVQVVSVNGNSNDDMPSVKYGDFLELPHNIKGFFDLKQAEQYAAKVGKPVFIDFTGHGCVNCREMEARVWSDQRVQQIMKNDYVVVALYADDKKEVDQSDWVTTDTGKVLKSLGKINSYWALTNYGVNAQPYYILQGNDGKQLVEARKYDLDVESFIDWLNRGKEAYAAGK